MTRPGRSFRRAWIPAGRRPTRGKLPLCGLLLENSPEGREAVLRAIGRNHRLSTSPEILGTIRKLIGNPEAATSLLPVLKWAVLADAEVVSLLELRLAAIEPAAASRSHRRVARAP